MTGGIAVAGRAGSGKSHLARAVVEEFGRRGQPAQVVSFASALKEEVRQLYGIEKGDQGSREVLIRHGEEQNASVPGYWIWRLAPVVRELWAAGVVPVCDDLRRLHEYDWLGGKGFYRVRVTAPLERRQRRMQEQGLDPSFALSEDPTEVDHEAWRFEARFHNASDRHLRQYAPQLVDRVLSLRAA